MTADASISELQMRAAALRRSSRLEDVLRRIETLEVEVDRLCKSTNRMLGRRAE